MANKTFWQKYDLDLEGLIDLYHQHGSYGAVAEYLGCSITTVAKYLKDVDVNPASKIKIRWYLKNGQPDMKAEIERALMHKKEWLDVYGDRIKQEEINMVFVIPPDTVKPVVNLKAILHDGTVTTLVHAPAVFRTSVQGDPEVQ